MDTHLRSITKAITWRIVATIITMSVAWVILRNIGHALEIGVLDTLIKLGTYYGHERLWDKISFGKAKAPEYYI